jgi:hypothetical protein
VTRVEELSRRREALAARCAAERDEIARGWAGIHRRVTWLERGGAAIAWLARRPWMLALGLVALSALGPRDLVRRAASALDVALLVLRLRSGS